MSSYASNIVGILSTNMTVLLKMRLGALSTRHAMARSVLTGRARFVPQPPPSHRPSELIQLRTNACLHAHIYTFCSGRMLT